MMVGISLQLHCSLKLTFSDQGLGDKIHFQTETIFNILKTIILN